MVPNAKIRRGLKWALCAILAVGGSVGFYAIYLIATDNFHAVVPGELYRSKQMQAGSLERAIQDYHIKTVLNLRGWNSQASWYRNETNTTCRLNVKHIDFSLSAGREVTDVEIAKILDMIESSPKPVLIHCNGGADRTGLISSAYLYSVKGESSSQAVRQLSPWYGHVVFLWWRYAGAMDRSYWRYVSNHTTQASAALGGQSGAQ